MNVLVVCAHPDDDAIGMGGTIRLHVDRGDVVYSLYLTSGEKGCPDDEDERVIAEWREREANVAAGILGILQTEFWREPDGRLDGHASELVWKLRDVLVDLDIGMVYSPWQNDGHDDHQEAASLVGFAIESLPDVGWWTYEIWRPLPYPDEVNDITSTAGLKQAAILAHVSQVRREPFHEAALCLSRYRAIMLKPSAKFAECFQKVR